ncbi:MAG: 50S ribosomal protein L3 [Candidatus Hadarchaeota archaeon]
MGKRASHPRRGSLAYMPRVRAPRPVAQVRAWPETTAVGLQGIAGYKAGMIQLFIMDDRKGTLTSGQEISVPATVLEVPPTIVCAVRLYGKKIGVLNSIADVWAAELPKDLSRLLSLPKKPDLQKAIERAEAMVKGGKVVDIRVIACTQPSKSSLLRKKPDLIEIRVGGSTAEERWNYSKGVLGKEVKTPEVFKEGEHVDVVAVSKGKGFQGPVKRWGIKVLPRKSEGGRRQVGTLGPWSPSRIFWTVPAPGQMGYHQRTEFNKRILKIGGDGKDVTPKGGFLRYGGIKSGYVVVAGSVPGPTKRLVQLRQAIRAPSSRSTSPPTITYISTASGQGR